MKNKENKICTRCVLDTTVSDIRFDEKGMCHYCTIHDELEKEFPLTEEGRHVFEAQIEQVKKRGKGKPYDIIIGVSGGRDSTFALKVAIDLGLRPLAVHFDNGWNSEIAVRNIKNATNKLNIDLYTYVVDWEEFKDLQISFLKASTSDAEIPTDVGIHGILHKIAARENIGYLVFAHSFRTEGVAPLAWTYLDGRYIKSVQKKFGKKRLKTFPNIDLWAFFYYRFFKRIKVIPLLTCVEYDQTKVSQMLTDELGWEYYGGHHHESYYTHFFQSYYLPKKFNIDKRKIEYSALIRSGQMNRATALKEIESEEYPYDAELIPYIKSKLRLSDEDFDRIMTAERKSFHDYPTYYPLIKFLRIPIKIACDLKLIPKHLYMKFLG